VRRGRHCAGSGDRARGRRGPEWTMDLCARGLWEVAMPGPLYLTTLGTGEHRAPGVGGKGT
jgi:hypothetical protein